MARRSIALKSDNQARTAPQLYGMAVNQTVSFVNGFRIVGALNRFVPNIYVASRKGNDLLYASKVDHGFDHDIAKESC
jgi:hypothetical protein